MAPYPLSNSRTQDVRRAHSVHGKAANPSLPRPAPGPQWRQARSRSRPTSTPHRNSPSIEIRRLVEAFVTAAQRSLAAGYEVIEIHGAHGYLINEFLSPLSNHRTDQYGGSFENRTRFLREIVQAVRHVWPERLPLFVRISATDWIEGGWNENDSVELARVLTDLGVDLIDCSSGGNSPDAVISVGPGYQVSSPGRSARKQRSAQPRWV